jgi:predicted PhzF superfamily epimerase YddE/YHI9
MEYHVIDVFTDKLFGGNPAGVCILERWLTDDILQSIANENNLSETAFIVTAKGNDCDFVSRFFAPNAGIDEDPVTGRAHCSLIPFWSNRLGKTELTAKQLSKRGGVLYCEDCGERVKIGGKAVRYLKGKIELKKHHSII